MRKGAPFTIAILVLTLFSPIFLPKVNAAVSAGPVMHYDIGDSSSYNSATPSALNDISGNGYNVTLAGSPVNSTNNGGFLTFNGSSQYGTLGNVTTNFTAGVSATFYANFGGGDNWERIIDFGTGQGSDNIVVARSGTNNDINLSIWNGNTSTGYCVANGIIFSGWAHYAVIANGTDCYFYRNGALWTNVSKYNSSNTLISAMTALPLNVTRTANYIGKSNWSADNLLAGSLGELSIYNRGLSAAEVYTNFQSEIFSCVRSTIQSGSTRYVKIYGSFGCMFTVPDGVTSIDYLMVGGGGGGGGAKDSTTLFGGGGGGAGGAVTQATSVAVTANSVINMRVGLGGAGGTANNPGGNGTDTSLQINGGTVVTARGGDGGGAGTGTLTLADMAGDGGANGAYSAGTSVYDGGGGGAGSGGNGSNGSDIGGQGGNGGAGGIGVTSAVSNDSSQYYGGGGGGGGTPSGSAQPASQTDGFGGLGGSSVGGNGGVISATKSTSPSASNGALDTGSGGGGGGWNYNFTTTQRKGGDGANGIIIIKFTLTQAAVSSISVTSSSGADQTYRSDETITVRVVFSQKVYVLGTPRIPIQGLTSKYLTFAAGSDTTTITFTYQPLVSDFDIDGFAINANTLDLNGGSIQDGSGNDVSITHSAISAVVTNAIDGRVTVELTITIPSNLVYRKSTNVTVASTHTGKLTVNLEGKRIAKCIKLQTTLISTLYTVVCPISPSVRGNRTLRIDYYQSGSNTVYLTKTQSVFIANRTGTR